MKLLMENWREYIKEVEAFDDIATTPEQIQQSIDWFYASPKFDRGEKKGEESWEGHTIITYGLSKGDEFHYVVNKEGNPVAYVATAPFREGYAVGNVRKSVKKPYASQLYQWLIDRYGVLYSDKAQTTDGAKTWERFPNKKRVETEDEDGKGRWRHRIGKEINEGFIDLFYKRREDADVSVEKIQRMYADYRLSRDLRLGGNGKTGLKHLKTKRARLRRMKEIEDLIPVLQGHVMDIDNIESELASGNFVWPKEMRKAPYRGVGMGRSLNSWFRDPDKALPHLRDDLLLGAIKHLKKWHARFADSLGIEKYEDDPLRDVSAIKAFMGTAKER